MPAAPPAAYPVPEATEAHLPAIVPEAPTRQGTVQEREATTVLPAHPLPETPPEVPKTAAVLQPDQYIRQGKQVLMSTPAGIQEVSLLPHPDRAPQEVREAQAQPEVQVPPIRPGATEATIPEATQGTQVTRTLPEIPATLPGVQEVAIRAGAPEVQEAVDTPEVRAEVPVAADAGSISMNTSNENSYESI